MLIGINYIGMGLFGLTLDKEISYRSGHGTINVYVEENGYNHRYSAK